MSKVPNYSHLNRESRAIAAKALRNIDPNFKEFLTISRFCTLYQYECETYSWMESQHEGPLYLYKAQGRTPDEEHLVFLIHNHKSRYNYKQIIRSDFELKLKDNGKIVVLNIMTPYKPLNCSLAMGSHSPLDSKSEQLDEHKMQKDLNNEIPYPSPQYSEATNICIWFSFLSDKKAFKNCLSEH